MDFQSVIRVFTMIVLCVFCHFPSHQIAEASTVKAPAELVTDACKLIGNQKSCIQTLKSNPQIGSVTNPKGLANLALESARKKSKATSDFFKSLLISNSGKSATETPLKECAKYFDEAAGMLNLSGLEGGTASLDVHYALDNANYCENALKEATVHIDSIAPAIQNWKDTFNVAFATVAAVESSENN